MISAPSETYLKKVELASSSKSVEKRLETLIKSGFKNASLEPDSLNSYRRKDEWISKYIIKERER